MSLAQLNSPIRLRRLAIPESLRWLVHRPPLALRLVYSLAVVVVGFGLAIAGLAELIGFVTGLPPVQDRVVAWSGDAVYGRLLLALLGNIQLSGVAGWLSVVFTSGSSAVGVQVVRLAVDVAAVAVGVAAWRRRPAVLAVAVGAYGAGTTLRLWWGAGGGGDMLLSMIATKVVGIDGRAYSAAMADGRLPSVGINLVLIGLATVAGLAFGWRRRRLAGRASGKALLAVASVALAVAAARPAVAFERASAAGVRFDAAAHGSPGALPDLPSVATIERSGGGWTYRVNGKTEVIQGIGYNAVTSGLTREQRSALYDRDFAAIRAAGANTIAGWVESEFDGVLMRKAAEHGLGVILPFHLGPTYVLSEPDYAYEDPRVRQQLLDAVSARVEQYRNSPALRMYGLGNEVLHAIAWAHDSPARAQAFANFLVVAADRVHQLDPNHPVVYRDAEDWYVQPIVNALAANPKPRPWFVYGMNFFTTRMQQALASGPVTGLDQPLMISEFGPVGLRAEARADGYRELWRIVRSRPDRVLGGSAYVWTTAGPEALDRSFGLTDADGNPVDGALAALASLYEVE